MLAQQYIELGWCSKAEIQEAARAWEEFAQNPAAVWLSAWFEAIGVKQ